MPISSSHSERSVLHVVVSPPAGGEALARAVEHLRPGDVLLLAQEAAPLAVLAMTPDAALLTALAQVEVCVLSADLSARGLANAPLRVGIHAVDDAGWVALAVRCATSVTWY